MLLTLQPHDFESLILQLFQRFLLLLFFSHFQTLSSHSYVSNVRFEIYERAISMSPLMSPQDGRTARMWAANNGSTETVTLLLERGADIEAKDEVRIRNMQEN